MVEKGARCPICQVVVDSFGDHQVVCGGKVKEVTFSGMISSEMQLFSTDQSAAVAAGKELHSLIASTYSRPADVFSPNWKGSQPAALDVHLSSFTSARL